MWPNHDGMAATADDGTAASQPKPAATTRPDQPPRTAKKARDKSKSKPKPKPESRLAAAVRAWLANVLPTLRALPLAEGSSLLDWAVDTLVAQAPRRWVVYEPMVLLPTGSFGLRGGASLSLAGGAGQGSGPGDALWTATPSHTASRTLWQNVLAAVSREQQDQLWRDVLLALSPSGSGGGSHPRTSNAQLTHLAVNDAIPLHVGGGGGGDDGAGSALENRLRAPTGLRPLYGDFGPSALQGGADSTPSDADFARAFWVSTKQNGIYQTWAPRWSMFSRGNVKEKARLLAWEAAGRGDTPEPTWAVDLYAGIGYFVFSYARRGLRVLGWELNPWSAEALRRGAERNGWPVRIVRGAAALARPTAEALAPSVTAACVYGDEAPAIVVFVEDNANAARRLAELRAASPPVARVAHVNCGLLPTSRDAWRTAWDAVAHGRAAAGWLHLHENVGVADVGRRQAAIQALVASWAAAQNAEAPGTLTPVVEHVELVKTFAPGVWHCVFDVRITRGG